MSEVLKQEKSLVTLKMTVKGEDFEKAMEFYKEVAEKESEIYFIKVAKEKVLELSLKNKEM